MTRYVVRRLLQFIPVVIAATFIIFALVFAIPGDPIRALSGDRPLSEAVQQSLRDRYNLDDALLVQYGKYVLNVLQGVSAPLSRVARSATSSPSERPCRSGSP